MKRDDKMHIFEKLQVKIFIITIPLSWKAFTVIPVTCYLLCMLPPLSGEPLLHDIEM
jgi:hypothetical protein